MKIVYEFGCLTETPPGSLLIHACNCQGIWGSGVAKLLKERFPAAFDQYHKHCMDNGQWNLLGTAAIFSAHPVIDGVEATDQTYYIGCVFTSLSIGKWKGNPNQITAATHIAMASMYTKIMVLRNSGHAVKPVYSTRLNSGNFMVDWKWTEITLHEIPWKRLMLNTETGLEDTHLLRLHVRTNDPEEMVAYLAREQFRASEEAKQLQRAATQLAEEWLQELRERPSEEDPLITRTGAPTGSLVPASRMPQIIEID